MEMFLRTLQHARINTALTILYVHVADVTTPHLKLTLTNYSSVTIANNL